MGRSSTFRTYSEPARASICSGEYMASPKLKEFPIPSIFCTLLTGAGTAMVVWLSSKLRRTPRAENTRPQPRRNIMEDMSSRTSQRAEIPFRRSRRSFDVIFPPPHMGGRP